MAYGTPLERGRDAYGERAWERAFRELSAADARQALGPDDLWRLGWAGALIGRTDDFRAAIERAHRLYVDAGSLTAGSRCAVWLGLRLASLGDVAQASGWLARARRLLDRLGGDHVENGYLELSEAQRHLGTGDHQAAFEIAEAATRTAERFGDADLHAFALHAQGIARLRQARVQEGLQLLDEAMLAVSRDDLMPIVSGIVYCSVISACSSVYALRRVEEWTVALKAWCDRQPELVPFSGKCMIHRAEIMLLQGTWTEALEEARHAEDRCDRGDEPDGVAHACYTQGQLHRLRGDFAGAEEAYRRAALLGRDPQPGLALLRLAQGKRDAAWSAIHRALDESRIEAARARLLPAAVEIHLAVGDLDGARTAVRELAEIARAFDEGVLDTIVAHWEGAVAMADGDGAGALATLRRAWRGWQTLGAPYEAARTRELVGLACRSLGDEETARLELEAARVGYQLLGAAADLARLEGARTGAAGLTPRELEVLRLVAGGGTNKAVAAALDISERTVERHLSNIFDKLGVSTRSGATAFAYEHGLA